MHKRLKDVSELVKHIIAIEVVVVIGYCTIMGLNIQKEFWALSGSILTYIFMSYTPGINNIVSKSNIGGVFKGIIAIGLIGVISYCTIKNIEIGKELWGIIGGVITFIFNSKNKE
jgi:hypothetical protein